LKNAKKQQILTGHRNRGATEVPYPPHDGFEGMGLLVELFLVVTLVACVFPLLTIFLEIRNFRSRRPSERNFVWAFLATYCLSLLSARWFVPLSLTEVVLPTAIWATVGTAFAMISFAFGFRSRGSGRWLAVVGGCYLTLVWLPFFYGRVLLKL
jgi:hypothetical protein